MENRARILKFSTEKVLAKCRKWSDQNQGSSVINFDSFRLRKEAVREREIARMERRERIYIGAALVYLGIFTLNLFRGRHRFYTKQ